MDAKRRITLAAGVLLVLLVSLGAGWIAWQRHAAQARVKPADWTLRRLIRAQRLFRDADADHNGVHDYGTIQQLTAAGLFDSADGEIWGYHFEARPSAKDPTLLWMATALPRVEGYPFMMTNQTGAIYFREREPFEFTVDCAPPSDAKDYDWAHGDPRPPSRTFTRD